MFVITADQVNSRSTPDLVAPALAHLVELHPRTLALAPDRTAGDELQTLTDDASTALAIVLELNRDGAWSVGVGCGNIREPLPQSIREATGPAFIAARDAVGRAKQRGTRFALCGANESTQAAASETEALIDLLLLLRERRTSGGWELYDLLAAGHTQRDAAERLGISAPAVSARARAAGLRAEDAAVPALVRLMARLNDEASDAED